MTQLFLLSTAWCISLGTTSAFAMMGADEFTLSNKGAPLRIKGQSQDEKSSPIQLLQDWRELGLDKTHPLDVKGGQKLTVACDFEEVTAPTAISFLNSAQNAYYEGGVTVFPGQKNIRFSSIVPADETRTWLIIRNPAFNGLTPLSFGLRLKAMDIELDILSKTQVLKTIDFLQDWANLGLIKTNPMDIQGGQELTVTCNFDEVTAPTAISFINSAQNDFYKGGVTVLPGQKSTTFSSVVPEGDTHTWLIIRNPGFDGKTLLPLGLRLNEILLNVGTAPPTHLTKLLNPHAEEDMKAIVNTLKGLTPAMEEEITPAEENWVSDTLWSRKPKPLPVSPISLENIEDMDTLKLPEVLGTIFESGWSNQDPEVLEAVDDKLGEIERKYYLDPEGTAPKLKLPEARRKANFITKMNGVWGNINTKLPKLTRADSL